MVTMENSDNKEHLSGVKTTVLCPADNAIYPRCIVHYYYHNQKNLPRFMEFEVLRDSFYQTLRVCLPIALANDVRGRTENEGIKLSVDFSKPNYPPVVKHVDNQCSIADMLRRDFAIDSQPSAMFSTPPVVNPLIGDPLGVVDIVYMTDGVGISVALSHGIVDISALVRVNKEWCRLAQSIYASDMDIYQPQMLNIDRQWFWNEITAQSTPVDTTFDKHIEALEEADRKKLCSTLVDKETPASLVFDSAETDNTLYLIGISSESINKISLVRSKICPDVSIPNFISAILWHCVFESCPDAEFSYFAASLTIRSDPLFSEYWGNTATMKYTLEKTTALHSSEIGNVARMIQRLVDEYSVAEFAHIIENYSNERYLENVTRLVEENNPSRLMVSNISRLPVYSIDFGFGQPVKTALAPHIPPGFASFFPKSKNGGIDILIRTLPKVIQRLTSDSLLMDYISVINYQR